MKLRTYYNKQFRAAIKKIGFWKEPYTGEQHFSKEQWLKVLRATKDENTRVAFTYSMLITIASDQTMHHYFRSLHSKFAELTGYPKYSRHGLGSHENPFNLLLDPVEKKLISKRALLDAAPEAAELFVDEVRDFFEKHIRDVNPDEFIERFVKDKDVRRAARDNPGGLFVASLKQYLRKK